MPESSSNWRSKSPQYLSHIFGHEGPDSLFSQLSKQGLATWISAGGAQKLNQTIDQFSVDIGLTEAGEEQYHHVMEVVYMYINQIK